MLLTHLFQDALIEELLQFFVAVVDTELLKAVMLKILWEDEKNRSRKKKIWISINFKKPVLIMVGEGSKFLTMSPGNEVFLCIREILLRNIHRQVSIW